MKQVELLLNLIKQQDGIITTKIVRENNIQLRYLNELIEKNIIYKASRGIYYMVHLFEDELLNLQTKYKKGIYSLNTALYLHGLTDTTPYYYTMSFPNSYNCSNPKNDNIICKRISSETHMLGVTQVKTPFGNYVFTYDMERTLCELLKVTSNIEKNIIVDAFKTYIKLKESNFYNLNKYAKIFNVEKKLRIYMEVLL